MKIGCSGSIREPRRVLIARHRLDSSPHLSTGAVDEIPQKIEDAFYERESEIQAVAQSMSEIVVRFEVHSIVVVVAAAAGGCIRPCSIPKSVVPQSLYHHSS